jgi:single-strand DNA-binding protein
VAKNLAIKNLKSKVMKNSKNTVTLEGFAGSDPVIINFANLKRLARVSIAVSEFYKNAEGEAIEQTHWFNLVFWNKKTLLIENKIFKGSNFRIEGRLSVQSYTDKKGEKRFTSEIIVNEVQIIEDHQDQAS